MSLLVRFFGKNRWEVAATLWVLVVDAVHNHYFEALNGPLREILRTPSKLAVGVILGSYLAYCVSLFYIGRLKPNSQIPQVTIAFREQGRPKTTLRTSWPKLLFFYPSFGIGFVVAMAAMEATGFAKETSTMSEGWQQAVLLGAVGLIVAHMILAAVDITPRYSSDTWGYFLVLVPTVLVSELMLNLSTAFWYRFLGPDAAGPVIENPSLGASFVVGLPLFLLFFAGPRFTFMSRSFSWLSLASGLGSTLFAFWNLLKVAPLL